MIYPEPPERFIAEGMILFSTQRLSPYRRACLDAEESAEDGSRTRPLTRVTRQCRGVCAQRFWTFVC